MHIGRTLPPAAAPIGIAEFVSGICGILRGDKEPERFQSSLKQHFGVKHCFLVSSGKAAFALVLLALKELFPGRDDVLIPAFTCFSVPSSVLRAGLKIRLCDLHPDTLDFDIEPLSATLSKAPRPGQGNVAAVDNVGNLLGNAPGAANDSETSHGRVLAVVPTHLFGFPSDVPRLRRLIQDPAVTIVEDAAQAMGETWDGRKLGTLGDVGFFSLGRGKAFSTVEGGVILTNRDDIAEVLNRLVGKLPCYGPWQVVTLIAKAAGLMLLARPLLFWIPRSLPFLRLGETPFEPHFEMLRMSSFQAGLAARWGERLQQMRDARKANVKRWLEILEEIGDRGSCFQHAQSRGLLRFPIRIRDTQRREFVLQESARSGAGIMPVYPESINHLPALRGEIRGKSFPVAESCARELVTLPTHEYLTPKDVTAIRRLLSPFRVAGGYRSA